MTDAIIEAAARAMAGWVWPGEDELHHDLAIRVLTAVTPMIEAAALERAAKVAEEHGERWKHVNGEYIADAIRALIVKDSE